MEARASIGITGNLTCNKDVCEVTVTLGKGTWEKQYFVNILAFSISHRDSGVFEGCNGKVLYSKKFENPLKGLLR